MRYLLDSTVLFDHAKWHDGASRLLRSLVEDGHDLYTCDVVMCESLSTGGPDEIRHIEVLLDALEYVSTTPAAARRAGAARRERRAAGGHRTLGDALIAAIASDLGATVVTRNDRDFTRQGGPGSQLLSACQPWKDGTFRTDSRPECLNAEPIRV